MPIAMSWDEMLDEFRALGGIAENVRQKDGSYGRGLFPIDPGKPVHLFAPADLLFDTTKIFFDGGMLRLRKASENPTRAERFFESYQNTFSWGGGGRADCEAKFQVLSSLPQLARDFLASSFSLSSGPGRDFSEWVERYFLTSRSLTAGGRTILMPVIELANYGLAARFKVAGGIRVQGIFPDEVLVRYSDGDALGLFATFGFASAAPAAFSLPLTVPLKGHKLTIARRLRAKVAQGRYRMPEMKVDGENAVMSHLMIGNVNFPRLSKGIFYRLMRDIGERGAEEIFDNIMRFNGRKLLGLLDALDGNSSAGAATMRQTIRHQLDAMTQCVGVREI